jgi:hypothetical protein
VLKVFMITDVASKLWTFIKRMLLQVLHRLPYDYTLPVFFEALVRKLAKVYAVSDDVVNLPKEVTSSLAVWTANFKSGTPQHLLLFLKLVLEFCFLIICKFLYF